MTGKIGSKLGRIGLIGWILAFFTAPRRVRELEIRLKERDELISAQDGGLVRLSHALMYVAAPPEEPKVKSEGVSFGRKSYRQLQIEYERQSSPTWRLTHRMRP